ncbi:MAG: lysylphosphatidylglycerol synthase domain-containing protein [Eubacterium sp.]|nr:lysylphosphatidylglycerol synthase domain-containing protein [Eubacterium sp.]
MNGEILCYGTDIRSVLILIGTVVTVHIVKAGRLYLALYGSDITLYTYMKTYCKVAPVSVLIPYKLGEIFKMYCYGKQLNSFLRGIVIVLFDRFIDTIALVTMIVFVRIFHGGNIVPLVYAFIIFLLFLLLLFFVFPGVHRFWKKYLLSAKATEHKLAILKILDVFYLIYQEIVNVSKGRGMILYVLSFIAWGTEIGSLVFLHGIAEEGARNEMISHYLSSAMGMGSSTELKQFVSMSVLLLIVFYAALKLVEILTKENNRE